MKKKKRGRPTKAEIVLKTGSVAQPQISRKTVDRLKNGFRGFPNEVVPDKPKLDQHWPCKNCKICATCYEIYAIFFNDANPKIDQANLEHASGPDNIVHRKNSSYLVSSSNVNQTRDSLVILPMSSLVERSADAQLVLTKIDNQQITKVVENHEEIDNQQITKVVENHEETTGTKIRSSITFI